MREEKACPRADTILTATTLSLSLSVFDSLQRCRSQGKRNNTVEEFDLLFRYV